MEPNINQSQQEVMVIASTATASPLPLNQPTVNQIIVYGGVSVCTIIAMTYFCDVLLKRLNEWRK